MPEPAGDQSIGRYRSAIAAVLGVLGLVQLLDGLYALLAPRSFFDDFPIGRGWVASLPDYSEHLVRDVGGLFIGTAVVLLAAAWILERRLVVIACVSFLAFSIPHTIYHYFNLDVYDTGDVIANVIALAATVVLPIWVLFVLLTGRAASDRGARRAKRRRAASDRGARRAKRRRAAVEAPGVEAPDS